MEYLPRDVFNINIDNYNEFLELRDIIIIIIIIISWND